MTVRVNSPLANGTVITNGTYSIDSSETAPVAGSAITTTVTSAPVLTVSATDAPDPVAAGGTIAYTLAYSNTGNSGATGVVLSDTVPVNTTFVSATGGGTLSAGVVHWSIGALAAGGSGSVQLEVRVNSPLANGTVITDGTFNIDSTETSPMAGSAITTTVTSALFFLMMRRPPRSTLSPCTTLFRSLAYSNTGNSGATGVVLSDTVPVNTTFVSATGGGTLSAGVVTWSIGRMGAGGGRSVDLGGRRIITIENRSALTDGAHNIDSTDTAPVTGSGITTAVTSAPVLAVSATDAADPVAAGGTITYTLAYANTGNSGATGVVLSDTVPVNTTFVSATGGGALSAGVVTWSIGALAAGGSGSVQLVVRVNSPLANGTIITHGPYSIDSTETSPVAVFF